MAATNTTTLTTAVFAEFITKKILMEARPFNVVSPLIYNDFQQAGAGKVFNRSQLPSTTAAAVAEGSDISATARTTTEGTCTISEVGLSTDLTDLAAEVAVGANRIQDWAQSHGRGIAQKITGDLCALFPSLNGSTAVGTSGTNITVANFLTAIYTLSAANAPGLKVCVLHPRQTFDLMNAVQASTGTPWSNVQEVARAGGFAGGSPNAGAGFIGVLFGVPVHETTEVTNVNSNVDRCGAMFVHDAMMFIQGSRGLRTEVQRDASARISEIVTTIVYGVAELVDTYGVPIETDDET